ncbi:MAG: hypothetical protein NVS3B19_17470 [Ginsengibacter sp.]
MFLHNLHISIKFDNIKNPASMIDSFESQKNTKSLSYTLIICAMLLVIFVFYKWPLKVPPVYVPQDLIEVNLGNEADGTGNVQPLVKGDLGPEVSKPSPQHSAPAVQNVQTINADEDKNQEAAIVNKTDKAIPKKAVSETPTPLKVKNISANVPVQLPLPAVPKLKVPLYKGGNGNGGNGAAVDNGYKTQGYIGGNGDIGSPNGKADSYGNSPGGRSGVSVVKGLSGRHPIHFPGMSDDFNENAKVYVDIEVDEAGLVTNASISRGTTTSNSNLLRIAVQKAKQLKFPASSNESERGTILFNFILKN